MTWVPPRLSGVPTAVHQVFLSLSRWLSRSVAPVGTINAYGGSTEPDDWLICDGRSLVRADYRELFDAIGTTWGAPSGTTFSLPDLRGRTLVGAGQGSGLTNRTLGVAGGAESHTLTTNEMPIHSHAQNVTAEVVGGAGVRTDYDSDFATASSFPQGVTTDSAGGNAAHNNMQPFRVVNFIIRAR